MASIHILYDIRTGHIIGVHHGPVEAADALQRAQKHPKVNTDQLAVLTVPANAVERGKQYTVDVEREGLIETPVAEGGVGFGAGGTGRLA